MHCDIRTGLSALVLCLGAVLAGCAAQPRTPPGPLPGQDACFWKANIFSWTVLDPSTLIVQAPGPRDAYLVKLFAPIPDLAFHEALGFEAGAGEPGRFCQYNGYVLAPGILPDRQPVTAVRALTPQETKDLLAAHGQGRTHQPRKKEESKRPPAVTQPTPTPAPAGIG